MTLCFRVTGVDDDKFHEDFPKITPLYNQYQKEGKNAHDDAPDATTGIAEKVGAGDLYSWE